MKVEISGDTVVLLIARKAARYFGVNNLGDGHWRIRHKRTPCEAAAAIFQMIDELPPQTSQ